MSASYQIESRDPRSRIRLAIGDTSTANARFQDEELDAFLEQTARKHYLWLYLDEDADEDVTAATAEIRIGQSVVEFALARTLADPDAPEVAIFPLAGSLDYDTIGELIEAINDLELGWVVGLDDGAFQRWLLGNAWSPESIPDSIFTPVLDAASMDLALTGGELDVYGSEAKKRLSVYDVEAAIGLADQRRRTGQNDFKELRDGDMTRVRFDAPSAGSAGSAAPAAYASWRRW